MAKICAKVAALPSPPNPLNCMNVCDISQDENKIVKQLQEKRNKLKFRLLDTQNQNQMLRKELKVANKVLRKEMPNLRSEDFKGHEEETISLRLKIMELQKQIEELEGTSDKQKDGKITYQDGSKQRMKSSNISKKQDPTEKLVRDCVDLKAKLEYWKNRNKELEKLSGQVRLELDRFLDKSVENKRIQSEYAGLERELRARQAEKLEMRCKLDNAKTRNCQLSDELSLIREDVERIRNKTEDDNMLLEALTSQRGNFQDLIDRQKMLGESDHRHFREDLREVHVKYTTSCNVLEQLEEVTASKDSILQDLQDYQHLLSYARDENTENTVPNSPATGTENPEDPENPERVEADPMPALDPELRDECEKYLRYFESAQEEVEHLAEIALNNIRKLNEWQEQLRQSKATSAQKKAEIRDLQESIKTLEGLAASKGAKLEAGKEDSSSTLDELLIKLDIEKEVHRFMIGHWKAVVAKTDGLFQIYATGADRTTKLFIDSLREKKKSFEKQPSAEEIKPRSSHTENDQQST
ncbi:protein Hook homolog 1-like [Argiope bruennichi]|uniref:protein Hook homolog 1-like n=1 Tax=Argiope bruennichi TaxID=94029 RepID=UPI0024959216|nr:protein Hook homolog 1-like [Argiope bruennichi]